MRWNGCLLSIALAALMSPVLCVAANFGTVVPIGGHASDIALDESRGLLYIANFTANRIEVMSTADYSIRTSMNVAPQPGAMSISPDSKFLLVAHYGNITPADPSKNCGHADQPERQHAADFLHRRYTAWRRRSSPTAGPSSLPPPAFCCSTRSPARCRRWRPSPRWPRRCP